MILDEFEQFIGSTDREVFCFDQLSEEEKQEATGLFMQRIMSDEKSKPRKYSHDYAHEFIIESHTFNDVLLMFVEYLKNNDPQIGAKILNLMVEGAKQYADRPVTEALEEKCRWESSYDQEVGFDRYNEML